ncbi:MAG: NB-ARC domain-containing protein, partial [Nitrospirae bacterium]
MKKLALGFLLIFLASCAATVIPEISLNQSDIKMELKQEAFGIEGLTISSDGQYLLTSDNGGSVRFDSGEPALRLWDLTQGLQIFKLKYDKKYSGKIMSVAISPDNKYAVTGGYVFSSFGQIGSHPLNIWDITKGQLLKAYKTFKGFRGDEFNSISFSQDGRYFLAADWTNIYIFDAKTWNLIKTLTLEGYSPPVMAPYKSLVATFSPNNKYVLSGGPDGIVRLLDIESGREIKQFHGHKAGSMYGGICSIEFSPNGKYAVTNSIQDSNVILWDIEKGVEARVFSDFEGILGWYFSPQTVSFSPDGKQVFIYGLPSKTFDINTGKGLIDFPRAWQGKGMYVAGRNMGWAQYHPNGRHILLNSNDASVRIYDAKTGQEVAILIGFEDGEWLTITSEGYYNSSEKGAQYLSVKVGETS